MCGVPAANFGDGGGGPDLAFVLRERPPCLALLGAGPVPLALRWRGRLTPYKKANSIDGSQYAQAPAATCTEEERAFADEVPTTCRIHIRQEILSSEYEEDAHKTAQSQREEPGHAGFGCS